MKILSLILKIAGTGLVCIWGVLFGIMFPSVILAMGSGTGIIPDDIAGRTDIMVIWIITSAAGYLIPAALIWGKHYRIAAVMSVIGLVGILTVHSMFADMYLKLPGNDGSYVGPSELYLPLIFVTLLDIFILAIEERKNIMKFLERKKKNEDEKAPSILGDD